MSIEQEEYYIIDQATLAFIMLASVFGAIVFSFVLFLIQFAVEGRRLRSEALASKARRLRFKQTHEAVEVSTLDHGFFHTFLSHVWGTGQDQMRIIKHRLVEMIPDLRVFLDVDGEISGSSPPMPFHSLVSLTLRGVPSCSDLEEIGHLEGYIDGTSVVLVYCSEGYFTSKNCMRELVGATVKQKPLIALTDPETKKGGLSLEIVHQQLVEADALSRNWNFLGLQAASNGANYQEAYLWPGGQKLYEDLFASEPIEWNRISHFQVGATPGSHSMA